jgi:hypothetical protein
MTAQRSRAARPAAQGLPRIDRSGQEILAAILEAGAEEGEPLTIAVNDEVSFEVRWRPLTWTGKSRAVSAATEYASDTNPQTGASIVKAVFHLDVYKKKALVEMVTACPFAMSESVIERFPEAVGAQFDAIIPDPFSSAGVAEMGKGTGSSS